MGLCTAAATAIWDVKKVEVERDTILKAFANGVPSFKQRKLERYFDAYLKEEMLFQQRARKTGRELSYQA